MAGSALSMLRPGKKCQPCKGKGCEACCERGFIIKTKKRTALKKAPNKKRRGANAEYAKLRSQFMAINPWCQVLQPGNRQCGKPATECHHRKGRNAHYLDVSTFLACCHECHQRLHGDLAEWAFRMGYRVNPASILPAVPPSLVFLPYEPS